MDLLILLLLFSNYNSVVLCNVTVMPLYLIPFRFFSNKKDIFKESNTSTSVPGGYSGPDDIYNSNEILSNASNGIEMELKIMKRESDRKPVKLTMKQGLIMNQIIGTYALENAENELCRNHTKEFKLGLRTFEPWALKSK